MRFGRVDEVRIPQGSAERIRYGDKVLWSLPLARYVSLGDSIAAGHTINADWEKDYGIGSQYGENGRKETVIVPKTYTDLIRRDLAAKYNGKITAISFAHSGNTVGDLMAKLDHTVVIKAIKRATLVTVCIGANNVLQPAMSHLEEYVAAGESALVEMGVDIENNLTMLADDSNANSYTALFNKLSAINPTAKYIFTAIYNPYKYLWIEEGQDGFFAPLLSTIPNMDIFGLDIDGWIKDGLLNIPIVQQLFDRVNRLGEWVEPYVTELNTILRSKIENYSSDNFFLAETKAAFDLVPDRPVTADKHYNDLVSVEYTRGYDTAQMDWGALWEGSNAATFWTSLALRHTTFTSGLDLNGLANELIPQIVEKVIVPDVDPHPEEYGHEVLKNSFANCYGNT